MQGLPRAVVALLLAVATVTAAVPAAEIQAASTATAPGAEASTGSNRLGTAETAALAAQPGQASTAPSPVVQQPNTTSRLVLPAGERETVRFGTARLDVGGSMAVNTARLHARYAEERLDRTFAAADGTAEQRVAVNRSAEQLDARIAALVEREREALRAYNRGQLSTEGYLRELAAIDAAARSLETTLDELHDDDRIAGMPVRETRIARIKARLAPLSGPVRAAVAEAMTGEDDGSVRVYVETSTSGFVLSMVEERRFTTRYVREAYHGDSFDRQWTDAPLDHDEFEDRFAELYPWLWGTNSRLNTVLTGEPYYFRAGIYGMTVNHPQGTETNEDLQAYYDAGTESVFYEVQRLDPASVPTETLASATDEGLRVELHTTYAGGPMAVRVTDTTTGEPVDATVTVDGDPVGSTGEDRLWTVAPRGTVAVTAAEGGRNVTASVTNASSTVANP